MAVLGCWSGHINTCLEERKDQWKVDRELANHSLSSTASQGTSNIPFPWFLMLGCNSQAQDLQAHYLLHLPHYLVPTFPVSWEEEEKCLWKIAGLMEDLFLGSQWSIILGYRRLSVKFLFFFTHSLFLFLPHG